MDFHFESLPLTPLHDPLFMERGIELSLYEMHLNHPEISGNKWFKLKYNLIEAEKTGKNKLLTFGGAWSNHIYATAAACKKFGFSSVGIIRGERSPELSSTLQFAEKAGMHLHFISRTEYRNKSTSVFIAELYRQFGDFYLIPEGGSNTLGVKGCTEIVTGMNLSIGHALPAFDYVCCPCGTGATLAGITLSLKGHQKAIGFSALKGGEFLTDEVNKFRKDFFQTTQEGAQHTSQDETAIFKINTDYHFGGYAKTTPELVSFREQFEIKHNIPLDDVYTAKMMFGIYDLIRRAYFKSGVKIIALHTGGLQSNTKK